MAATLPTELQLPKIKKSPREAGNFLFAREGGMPVKAPALGSYTHSVGICKYVKCSP